MVPVTSATSATSKEQLLVQEAFEEGYDTGKKEQFVKKLFTIFLSIFLGLVAGYWLCYKVYLSDLTKCEKDSLKLENEFHEAVAKPRSFHIFNHQFRVWPVDTVKKAFHYKKVSYAGIGDSNERRTWER